MSESESPQEVQAVAKRDKIRQLVESDKFKNAITSSLPEYVTAEYFVRITLNALMRQPKLAECTQESIFKCFMDSAGIGLPPDGRRLHIIPYYNSKIGKYEAVVVVDYKGLIELAKRHGDVALWQSHLVCSEDQFSWEDGVVHHRIDWLKPRGKVLAVYSHVRTKDGENDFEVMTADEIEAIRRRSKSPDTGPWATDFGEMAKKTTIKRHSKRLVLSPTFHRALDADQDMATDENYRVSIAKPEFAQAQVSPTAGSTFLPAPEPPPGADGLVAPSVPTPVEPAPPTEPPKRRGRPPGVKQTPTAPETEQEPQATTAGGDHTAILNPAKTAAPPASIQAQLESLIRSAGYTWDEFKEYTVREGWVGADKTAFASLPDQVCNTIIKYSDSILADMRKLMGH